MSDLIDRQAAIDAADRTDYTGLAIEDVKKVTDEVVKELKRLPSVQSERKKGKWLYHESIDVFECSVCGHQMVRNIFYYCPWCGADMRGEGNEN